MLEFFKDVTDEQVKQGKDKNGNNLPNGALVFTKDRHIFIQEGAPGTIADINQYGGSEDEGSNVEVETTNKIIKVQGADGKTYYTEVKEFGVSKPILPATTVYSSTTTSVNINVGNINGTCYYTTDGSDPKTSSTRQTTTGIISLPVNLSVASTSITIKVVNYQYSVYSDVTSVTFTTQRKLKTPTVSLAATPDAYTSSRTVNITKANSSSTLQYSTDNSTWTTITDTTLTVTTNGSSIYVREIATDWVTSATASVTNIQVGLKPIYWSVLYIEPTNSSVTQYVLNSMNMIKKQTLSPISISSSTNTEDKYLVIVVRDGLTINTIKDPTGFPLSINTFTPNVSGFKGYYTKLAGTAAGMTFILS